MARSDKRTAELILKVTAEKHALEQAKKQLHTFDDTLRSIGREQKFDRLAQGMSKAVTEGRKLNQVFRQARKELKTLGASDQEVARVVRQFSRLRQEAESAGRATNLAALGRELRLQAPAVPIPGLGVSSEQGFRLIEVAGKLGLSFKDLAIAGAAAGVSIAGIALAIKLFVTDTIEPMAKLISDITKAQRIAAGFLVDATTETAIAEVARLEGENARKRAEQLRAAQQRDEIAANLSGQGALGQALTGAGRLLGVGPVGDAIKSYDELGAAIAANQVQIDAYIQQLGGLGIAQNDAAAAFLAAQKQQEQLDLAALNIRNRFGAANLETIEKQIEATRRNISNNEEFLKNQFLTAETTQRLTAETERFKIELDVLTNELLEGAQAAQRRADAEKRASEGAKAAIENLREQVQFTDRLNKAAQSLTDFAANFAARIQDIQRKVAFAIEDAEHKRGLDLAEARRKAGLDEQEAIREAGIERLDIVRKAQQAITRILRRSRLDEQRAIQDRDAVALFAARERRDEEVRTEKENRGERLREIKRGLGEELRQLRQSAAERIRAINMQHRETLRRTRLNAQRTIALETEKFKREFAIRVRNAAQQLGISEREVADRVAIHAGGATAMIGITHQMIQGMVNAGLAGVRSVSQPSAARQVIRTSAGRGGGISRTAFHRSGVVTRSGQASLLKGEIVLNPRQGQTAGDIIFNFNGVGLSQRQVQSAITRSLLEYGAGRREAGAVGAYS